MKTKDYYSVTQGIESFTEQIVRNANFYEMRTGQYMFNCLPLEIQHRVRATLFDPFHKDLSPFEIAEWIDNHLIFDGLRIIALFNGNQILWEEE